MAKSLLLIAYLSLTFATIGNIAIMLILGGLKGLVVGLFLFPLVDAILPFYMLVTRGSPNTLVLTWLIPLTCFALARWGVPRLRTA
jgi:hypothetical protein